jgi:hypothetical protein
MNNHLLQTILYLDARALCWVLSKEVLTILRHERVKLDALTCVYSQKKASVYDVASASCLVQQDADIPRQAQEHIQKALRIRAAARLEARLTCISKLSMTDEEKAEEGGG